MVKCTNGISVIEVTEGAYNTIFKDQGYRPIAEVNKKPYKAKEPIVKPAVNEVPETKVEPTESVEEIEENGTEEIIEENESDEFAELLEKPIGQWTNQEVKDFANAKGIDITGTKNAKEAKNRILKYLNK